MEPTPATTQTSPADTSTSTNAEHDHFYMRVFALATITLLGFTLYKIIQPFLGTIIWAMFLAFLLHPLHLRITSRLKKSDNLSAALLTLVTFIILIGPITVLSSMLVTQAGDLVSWIQNVLTKQTHQQYQILADLPAIAPLLQGLHDNFDIQSLQIEKWIAQVALQLQPFLTDLGGKIFLGAINTTLAFVVMLFMLFFFLRDGAEFTAMLRDLIPMTPDRRALLLNLTRAVVFGTGLTALIQGSLVGLGFLITGLAAPLVYGMLATLLALLPFGGTAFIWIPAVFVLVGQARWDMAITMLVIGMLSSTIDNVIRPLLISRHAEIGTLTVFIGVLGGVAAFGLIGFVLGPVVLALIIALMRFALELRRVN